MSDRYIITKNTLTDLADSIRYKSNIEGSLSTAEMISTIRGLATSTEKPLNFEVVGAGTRPPQPVENTIWVKTSTIIGEWQMSYAPPTTRVDVLRALEIGDVWIKLGNGSTNLMNISKLNGMFVCPAACYQWDGLQWVFVDSYIWKNGSWSSTELFLFKDGTFDATVGGWTTNGNGAYQILDGCIDVQNISLPDTGNRYSGSVNAIDVTNYNTITFVINSSTNTASNVTNPNSFGLSSSSGTSNGYVVKASYHKLTSQTTVTLDISSLTGSYYILVSCYCYNQDGKKASYNIESIKLSV